MLARVISFTAAFVITITVMSLFALPGRKRVEDLLTVATHGHYAEVHKAVLDAGIPDIRIVSDHRSNLFPLVPFGFAAALLLQLLIFALVYYPLKWLLGRRTASNDAVQRTAPRSDAKFGDY